MSRYFLAGVIVIGGTAAAAAAPFTVIVKGHHCG